MDDAVERLRAKRNAERAARYVNYNTAPMAPVMTYPSSDASTDTGSLGWFVFGMVLPPLGLVTWLLNHKDSPNSCKKILKGMIAGIIVIGISLCFAIGLSNMSVRAHLEDISGINALEYGMPTLSGGSSEDGEFKLTPADEYDVVMA